MRPIFSFLLFILSALWPNIVDSFDYCTIPCAEGKVKHTMCQWAPDTGDFSGKCKNSVMRLGLSKELKEALLHHHNLARSTIAQGLHLSEGSGEKVKASNMMQLRWNNEAAAIAQRWANQCKEDHDECRTLSDKTDLGQISFSSEEIPKNETLLGETAVRSWMSDIIYLNETTYVSDLVDNFQPEDFNKIAHYTQMAWAMTAQVGCGLMESVVKGGKETVSIFCNYAPGGNVLGVPMYLRGEPCSKCPNGGKCSPKYPGLCLDDGKDDNMEDDEIVEINEKDQKREDDSMPVKQEVTTAKSEKVSSAFSFKLSPLCAGCTLLFVLLLLFQFV